MRGVGEGNTIEKPYFKASFSLGAQPSFPLVLTARLRDFADPTGQRDSAHKGPSVLARRVKYSQLTGRTLYNMIYLCAWKKVFRHSFQMANTLTFYRSAFQNNFAADLLIQRTVSRGRVTPTACYLTRPEGCRAAICPACGFNRITAGFSEGKRGPRTDY